MTPSKTMNYTTFNRVRNDQLLEPMFFGAPVNVSRYDQQKHSVFEKLSEKMLSFFWRPEEVDMSRDAIEWKNLPENEKHIFVSNLKYQTLLDSITARSVNMMFLPIVSLPELETLLETHSFTETIHSRSYTHIIRNVFTDPSAVFDDIVINPAIIKRAEGITVYFDDLIYYTQLLNLHGEGIAIVKGEQVKVTTRIVKEKLFLAMSALNALESIRFYVSFACTFAFSERKLMDGTGKILRLVARDEAVHKNETQVILNLWASGQDDPEMKEISEQLKEQGRAIFLEAVAQEEDWADELFKYGSMIGLNATIIKQYVRFVAGNSLRAINLESPFDIESDPLPWMKNHLQSSNIQVAPQEAEISSYLVGQIDSNVDMGSFVDMDI